MRQTDQNTHSTQLTEFSRGRGSSVSSEDIQCFDIRMGLLEINARSQEKQHQEEIMHVWAALETQGRCTMGTHAVISFKLLRVCTAARVPPSRAVCFQALGSPGRNPHPWTRLRLARHRLPASAPDTWACGAENKPVFSQSPDAEGIFSRALQPQPALPVHTPAVAFGSRIAFPVPPQACAT